MLLLSSQLRGELSEESEHAGGETPRAELEVLTPERRRRITHVLIWALSSRRGSIFGRFAFPPCFEMQTQLHWTIMAFFFFWPKFTSGVWLNPLRRIPSPSSSKTDWPEIFPALWWQQSVWHHYRPYEPLYISFPSHFCATMHSSLTTKSTLTHWSLCTVSSQSLDFKLL